MTRFLIYHLIFATAAIQSMNTKYVLIEITHNKLNIPFNQYDAGRYTPSKRMNFENNTVFQTNNFKCNNKVFSIIQLLYI